MKKLAGLGDIRLHKTHPPLRTCCEMSEVFGVAQQTLAVLLRHHGGPAPVFRHKGTVRATWYDPKTMRDWWASLPEDVRKGKTK